MDCVYNCVDGYMDTILKWAVRTVVVKGSGLNFVCLPMCTCMNSMYTEFYLCCFVFCTFSSFFSFFNITKICLRMCHDST